MISTAFLNLAVGPPQNILLRSVKSRCLVIEYPSACRRRRRVRRAKKIINNPKYVVTELLEGMVEACHGRIRPLSTVQALVKSALRKGKGGLLVGGGSGREPVFHGFIGDNLADGAACGNISAAPTPAIILEVTRAVDQGKGVLYLYGNYAGDNMNFDIAAEMAVEEGIAVKTVRVWDDVASASSERASERRGIAGDLFVIKIAGGAAVLLDSLDEVYRVAAKARDSVRSMGVAVAAGAIPETGEPTFELPEDEIEIGMGLHGEPGVAREKLLPAEPLVEKMMDEILADLPFRKGDEVALLVNDLGSTTMMEVLIVNRKWRQLLRERGVAVHDTV